MKTKLVTLCVVLMSIWCIYPMSAQATPPETRPGGPAATLVMNYLTAAGTLDPSATRVFLSTTYKDDIVTEFQANGRSGWNYSAEHTEIEEETIDALENKATVAAAVVFKGGQSLMIIRRTFFLILENGEWKISGLDPVPMKTGPGVVPLSR